MSKDNLSTKKITTIQNESFFTSGDIFRKLIYIPELKVELDSIQAAILFTQMEYWFLQMTIKTGEATFYKSLTNKEDPDSWINEIGYSEREYRYAFDKIGVRHGSKSAYYESIKSVNPFVNKDGNEMYFSSYVDKYTNKIHYQRNKSKIIELMDKILNKQIDSEQNCQMPEMTLQPTKSDCATDKNLSCNQQKPSVITGDYTEDYSKTTHENTISPDGTIGDSPDNLFLNSDSEIKNKRRLKLKLKSESPTLIESKSIYPKGLTPKNKPDDLDINQYNLYCDSLKLLYDYHIEEMKSQNKTPNIRYLSNTQDEHIRSERYILKELIKRFNNESVLNLIHNHVHKMKTDQYYAKSALPSKIQEMYDKGRVDDKPLTGVKCEKSETDKLKELANKDPIQELFPLIFEMKIKRYMIEGPRGIYMDTHDAYKLNLPDKWQYSLNWFWKEKPRIDAIMKELYGKILIDKYDVQVDKWTREEFETHIEASKYTALQNAMNEKDDRWNEFSWVDRDSQSITIDDSLQVIKNIRDARSRLERLS